VISNYISFKSTVGFLDADTTLAYMKKMSPITIGVERRIRFI